MNDLDNNFVIGKLQKTLLHCLYRSLYIGFNYNSKFLQVSFLNLCKQII